MARAFEIADRFRCDLPAAIAARVFEAKPGTTLGPFAEPRGFTLIQIESLGHGTLNARTRNVLRDEIFRAWVAKRLGASIRFPILEAINCAG